MTYSRRQPEFATHKECAYFSDGFCTLSGVAVDRDEAACPNFTPRDMALPQAAEAYQQPRQIPRVSVPVGERFLVSPSYPESYPVPQRGYGVHSMSSGRGGGGGRGRNSGGRGRGRGRMGGFAAGPGGSCVCPSCGYTASHKLGSPCSQQTCPRCGTRMTRKQ